MLACSSSATAATTTSPARLELRRVAAGDQRRGEPRLHVVRAAPVQPVALDPGRERRVHPLDVHRVRVAAEEQRPAAAAAARPDDDARTSGSRLEDVRLETGGARPLGDERRDRGLAGAARDERGVDRVDLDEAGEELGRSRTASLPSCTVRRRPGGLSWASLSPPARCLSSRGVAGPDDFDFWLGSWVASWGEDGATGRNVIAGRSTAASSRSSSTDARGSSSGG